jgi:hypothetical protein
LDRWFNTCTITTSGARNWCSGADEAIHKAFPIREEVKFELTAQAFNFTNAPWFGAGDNGAGIGTSATTASFGRVNPNQGTIPGRCRWPPS